MEEKQNQRTERLIELQREMKHPGHDHRLVLRESVQGAGGRYGGGCVPVKCDGCGEPISSSFSLPSGVGGGGGNFYACPNSDCWFLLHKRCAELPTKIEHPSHLDHALTLHPFHGQTVSRLCDVCYFGVNGFLYGCSDCDFDIHVCCASMALHIQDGVDENYKIHQHQLIPIEMEAQFLCAACGREHKGKSYLCPTCGFWANQICASVPTTIDLHSHDHPLTLFRSFRYHGGKCKICKEVVNRAYWLYHCSKICKCFVHVDCLLLEKAEDSIKDIQTNSHSESTSHKTEIPITLPLLDESAEIISQLIKNLKRHKRATRILHCKENHPLIFVNEKTVESEDDLQCEGCAQTILSEFYYCSQCEFSLHEWCLELPNELPHILHPKHSLYLRTFDRCCYKCASCRQFTDRFVFSCFTCNFHLDLKCASLPRIIKHRGHDHNLILRSLINIACNACGANYIRPLTTFRCEACNFGICIECALLPLLVRHRYDKHPYTLTYSSIEGQPNDYYCEICEEDINSMYWFYHCIKCDQSLHPKCIYPIK